MSMLTPLGSGGRTRRGRRWPRVLLALLVLAAVAGAGYAAWHWVSKDESTTAPASASPSRVCRTPSPKTPKVVPSPAEVTVTVANGTDRSGLAVDTADELAAVGFDVNGIGNTSKPVKTGVAEIRYRPDDLAAAISVAAYLPGSRLVEVSQATNASVTLWLGPEFDGVAASEDADPAAVALPTPEPVCRTPKS